MEVPENSRRALLCEFGYGDATGFFEPSYDSAIIGVTYDDRVVYDFDKMVECLAKERNIPLEEAKEFIEVNAIRALSYYPQAPIVMFNLEPYFEEEKV